MTNIIKSIICFGVMLIRVAISLVFAPITIPLCYVLNKIYGHKKD